MRGKLTGTEKDDINSNENGHTWSELPNPGVSSYAQVSFLLESKGSGELSKGNGLLWGTICFRQGKGTGIRDQTAQRALSSPTETYVKHAQCLEMTFIGLQKTPNCQRELICYSTR